MSDPLRRAQVRPRLQKLADDTGLPLAVVASRALQHGLAYIEGDLARVFPAALPPVATAAGEVMPTTAPPSTTAPAADPPLAAAHTADTQETTVAPAMERQPTAAPAMDRQPTAALAVDAAPAPRARRLGRVSSEDAARALNKSPAAFKAHLHRHPELKRHAKRAGRAALWDLDGLRANWAQ
jgi:hypothetical protein